MHACLCVAAMQERNGHHLPWASMPLDITQANKTAQLASSQQLQQARLLSTQAEVLWAALQHQACLQLAAGHAAAAVAAKTASAAQQSTWRFLQPEVRVFVRVYVLEDDALPAASQHIGIFTGVLKLP